MQSHSRSSSCRIGWSPPTTQLKVQAHSRSSSQDVISNPNGLARATLIRTHAKSRQQDSPLIVGLVSLVTESLRVLGVGKDRYTALQQQEQVKAVKRLRPGDVRGVMNGIRKDFKQGYFVTGIITDQCYAEDCLFADPTISFTGLQLWKRNLQLLVPFLIEPEIGLIDLRRTGKTDDGSETLRAEWSLQTYLSLPWRPFISILGATTYTLNEDKNQVVEHVEEWNISALEALAQIFRPGNYQSRADM